MHEYHKLFLPQFKKKNKPFILHFFMIVLKSNVDEIGYTNNE